MKFTDQLWTGIRPIYDAIIEHPFNRELAEGTLATERFRHYVRQDALYLVDFSRSLAVVGARAREPDEILRFLGFARDAIVVERALHQEFFRRFSIRPTDRQAPACLAYTQFLLATAALGGIAEAIAALLPCFWIYREVGMHILGRASAGNPYQPWIDTYSGDDFADAVRSAVDATDGIADSASADERRRMTEAFVTSSRLEWMFWDGAWRLEGWPT